MRKKKLISAITDITIGLRRRVNFNWPQPRRMYRQAISARRGDAIPVHLIRRYQAAPVSWSIQEPIGLPVVTEQDACMDIDNLFGVPDQRTYRSFGLAASVSRASRPKN